MMRLVFVSLFICSCCLAQKVTISGYVRDQRTGESLIGATVISPNTASGTTTNAHGFFSLTLHRDSVRLLSGYVGYQPIAIFFQPTTDTLINFQLFPQVLDEVVVRPSFDVLPEESMLGTLSMPASTIKSLPFMLGEVDLLKALQLLPGIHAGDENSTGLYVRGGGPDQNLILLDGAPIYNASHLFGFFSIFNPDAINHVELTKGGFPARYGGRLSSVVDISMKDGNMRELKGEGSIGILSSKFTLEGPFLKDRTSFIVSARRTYFDLLAKPFLPSNAKIGYFFTDLNVKVNHIISSRDRIFFSTYFGVDEGYSNQSGSYTDDLTQIAFKKGYGVEWGNLVSAVRWTHVFGSRLFANISGTFSNYHFNVSQTYEERETPVDMPIEIRSLGTEYESGIRDWSGKVDFDFLPNPKHTVRFGFSAIQHRFSPGVSYYHSSDDGDSTKGATIKYAFESANYIEDEWKISNRLRLNAGVHFSAFNVDDIWYQSTQPRISTRYSLDKGYAIMAAASLMTQYIHLLTNAGVGLPTDLWVPSTSRVMPQQSGQLALGVSKSNNNMRISVEGYYKSMKNLIEYREGTSYLNTDNDWQDKVAINGTGESYGVEFLLNKTKGVYTGLVGYTLSKTTRQFDELNFGRRFPYKYDRRHDISFSLNRELKKRIDLSVLWVYGSGNAISLPIAIFQVSNDGQPTRAGVYYGDRNASRLKSYHRLDLNISWKKTKKWGERRWTVAIYNAYNRLNPFFVNLELNSSRTKYQLVQYSLFPIIPSISYGFKF